MVSWKVCLILDEDHRLSDDERRTSSQKEKKKEQVVETPEMKEFCTVFNLPLAAKSRTKSSTTMNLEVLHTSMQSVSVNPISCRSLLFTASL